MNGSIIRARDEYVTALQAIPGLNVSTHGGMFGLNELKRYTRLAPAAVITVLGFDTEDEAGIIRAGVDWGCIVFVRDEPADPKAVHVVNIAEQVVSVLQRAFVGDFASRPAGISCRNMYDVPIDGKGIAMWRIEWSQAMDLAVEIDAVPLADVHADWDLTPRDNDAPLGQVLEASDDIVLDQ